MLAWSIEAALNSGCFDHVVVSTDDREIADISLEFGASVPFLRPSELSDDHTGTIPVVRHAIEWFNGQGEAAEYVCCLYATAPFVLPADIQKGLELISESDCDYVFSVTGYPFPIQRAIRISGNNRAEMINPELFYSRSQDLEETYHDAGQFYWGRVNSWLEEKLIFGPGSTVVHLPRYRVQDIDTPEDWVRAELMFKALQHQSQ